MTDVPRDPASPAGDAVPTNFIRAIIDEDLRMQKHAGRRWAGRPGPLVAHREAPVDPAAIRTRFPPEPNGYLHIGHAKSICLNFGLAADYGGRCHLRFDDTNPEKEEQEYVDSIIEAVDWLGFAWKDEREDNLYFASDYFGWFYEMAEWMVQAGHAYVDSQSAEEMRSGRGTLTAPGRDSPYRGRSPDENLRLLREMRAGRHAEGTQVLRAKIDMASPNLNLRDPALYRIRFAEHHRTGSDWCIYPMYDYAHPLEDALERITHSLCTLEFEDHRPLYDWLLERLAEGGFFARPLPRQIEFARLNLEYTITSKRRLQALVRSGAVDGWDDPRMTTIAGLRRRGYSPEAIRLFCERIGLTKSDSWIEMSALEQALRDDLEPRAPRAVAVLDPLKLVIDNWPEGRIEECEAPVHPHRPELGRRRFPFARELWIEREDFAETPPKGFFRLFPGNRVRLRYGFVVECTGCDRDAEGNVTAVHATAFLDSKSGTPGADAYRVKGNLHWVAAHAALDAEVRLYGRLFTEAQPGAGDTDPLDALNPASKQVLRARLEPGLADAAPESRWQFERHGYFVADRVDHGPGRAVFNRAVGLKDPRQIRREEVGVQRDQHFITQMRMRVGETVAEIQRKKGARADRDAQQRKVRLQRLYPQRGERRLEQRRGTPRRALQHHPRLGNVDPRHPQTLVSMLVERSEDPAGGRLIRSQRNDDGSVDNHLGRSLPAASGGLRVQHLFHPVVDFALEVSHRPMRRLRVRMAIQQPAQQRKIALRARKIRRRRFLHARRAHRD